MRYLSMIRVDEKSGQKPSERLMTEMGKLIEEETKAGVLLATEGFHPSHKDVRVAYADGNFTVTDGPFTETKEVIGGFALLQCKSREEAIEACKRFLRVVGGGQNEIHELPEGPFNSMRRSVITDGWKLTERGARRFELYNLERDPGERTNLAQSAPEDLARMRLVLEQVRSRLHPVAAPEARPRD